VFVEATPDLVLLLVVKYLIDLFDDEGTFGVPSRDRVFASSRGLSCIGSAAEKLPRGFITELITDIMDGFNGVVGTHEEGKLHHIVSNYPGLAQFPKQQLTWNRLDPDRTTGDL
jgi:hypothetical protein